MCIYILFVSDTFLSDHLLHQVISNKKRLKQHRFKIKFTDINVLFISSVSLLNLSFTYSSNYEMETPLHFAATSGCTKTVECLLKNNRSVITLENVVGETAAMFAAVEGHTKVLQHLFKYDVQLWSSSTSFKKQKTCLDWAVLCKKSDTAAAILDYGDWKEVCISHARISRAISHMKMILHT